MDASFQPLKRRLLERIGYQIGGAAPSLGTAANRTASFVGSAYTLDAKRREYDSGRPPFASTHGDSGERKRRGDRMLTPKAGATSMKSKR